MATACATTRLTRERSTAMVANMLRVALYTVTYCRGGTTMDVSSVLINLINHARDDDDVRRLTTDG